MKSNDELHELLIRMDEGQKYMIERMAEIDDRLKEADKGRSKLREDIYKVTEDVFIVGQTVSQQNHVITALSNRVEDNHKEIKPVLENIKVLRAIRKYIIIILVAAGLTGATLWTVAREWLMALLAWLQRAL